MTKLVTVVAAALYNAENMILLARRPEGKPMAGLWEFPGGKIEPGETPEQALVRELYEELSIGVLEKDLIPLKFASFSYPDFHLLMPLYTCRKWSGTIDPKERQKIAWVLAENLSLYEAPAADVPLFEFLASFDARE